MKKLLLKTLGVLLLGIILLPGFLLMTFSEGKYAYGAEESEEPCPKPYINSIAPKAALPGEEVTIRGNRLGTKQGSVVFAPDIKAQIVKWTYKKVWVTVPQEAQSGPLYIISSCGKMSNKDYFVRKASE
ncbi:MAG: hypothetical protein JXD19_12495 [Deltaproteobacteria bacterium]|nr:hypothetical protein [Deltaproteobacteria bacterium]